MRKRTQLEIVISTLVIIGLVGTIAYHNLEHWSYTDSFYFTGITMLTIGYGDLHPTTPISKIFTVFFGFFGVGMSLLALSLIATSYVERRERQIGESLQERFAQAMKKNGKRIDRKKREIINGSRRSIERKKA